MKVHEVVAQTLLRNGVTTVFGLMGDANMLYLSDYLNGGGRFVPVAFEGASVSMADGWSRATSGVGVCSVTHGPALTNTLTALVEAVRNHSRVLLITGGTPRVRGHLQSIDIARVCSVAQAGYERVTGADTAAADIERALRRVIGENLPVVLDVEYDLLTRDAEPLGTPGGGLADADPRPHPDPVVLDEALGLVASARRPIVLAGRGAVRSGARSALIELADRLGAPLATSLLGKDYFRGHPHNLGICGTLSTGIAAAEISTSDCVVAFGASLNEFTADSGHLLNRDRRIVHCDVDSARPGADTPYEIAVIGDARATAQAMVDRLREAGHQGRQPSDVLRAGLADNPYDPYTDVSTHETVDIRTAMIRLDQMLPAARNVVTDVGRFMMAPWRYLHVADPRSFMHTTNFGSIGLGLSTAIGVGVARPDIPTVLVAGDGGLMMGAQELHAAVRTRIPLLVVVANDGSYGAEWRKLNEAGVDPKYSLNTWPDFVDLAGAVGMRGVTVRNIDDLASLTADLADLADPLLVDLRLDPSVDIH